MDELHNLYRQWLHYHLLRHGVGRSGEIFNYDSPLFQIFVDKPIYVENVRLDKDGVLNITDLSSFRNELIDVAFIYKVGKLYKKTNKNWPRDDISHPNKFVNEFFILMHFQSKMDLNTKYYISMFTNFQQLCNKAVREHKQATNEILTLKNMVTNPTVKLWLKNEYHAHKINYFEASEYATELITRIVKEQIEQKVIPIKKNK